MADLDNDDTAEIAIEILKPHDGEVVIRVVGDIDLATVEHFRQAVDSAIARGATRVVFDLSAVDFMDSSGIAVLLGAAQTASVDIRRPSSVVRIVIEATGLRDVLRISQ